jgi:hypothetical protein
MAQHDFLLRGQGFNAGKDRRAFAGILVVLFENVGDVDFLRAPVAGFDDFRALQ